MESKGFFPLQLVVFPYEKLRLHIFESRYRQLIDDHRDGVSTFAIPTVINKQLMPIAGVVRVANITKEYEDGKKDIEVESVGLCKIHSYHETLDAKQYAGGTVADVPIDFDGKNALKDIFKDHVQQLYQQMTTPLKRPFSETPWTSLDYGHLLGFNLDQEYSFLTLPKENDRLRYGIQYIADLLRRIEQMKNIKFQASLNGEYRSYPSPDVDETST